MYRLKRYDKCYREYIKKDIRTFKYSCILDDVLLNDNQVSTFSLEYDLTDGSDDLTLGNLASTKLNISFSSDVNVEENSTIKLSCSLLARDEFGTEVWAEVALGEFNVYSISEKKISKTIVAYDKLYKKNLARQYLSNLKYDIATREIDLYSVMKELCSTRYLDVVLDKTAFESYTLPRPEVVNEKILRPDGKYEIIESNSMQVCLGMTVGQALGYIASYLGGNFILDGDKQLKLVRYRVSDADIEYFDNKFNVNSRSKSSCDIRRIDCTTHDNNILTVGNGDESTSFKLENPFMDDSKLNDLLNNLASLEYSPMSVKIFGDPTIQLGDAIRVYFGDNINADSVLIPVMRMKSTFSGGCVNEIESVYPTKSDKDYNYKGTLATKVDDLSNTVVSVSSDLERINESISRLETVKDNVDAMDGYIATLSEQVSFSKKYQYEILLDNILSSDVTFSNRYSAVVANKYLN